MTLSSVAMTGGLLAGYGGLAVLAARYLYPSRPATSRWQFVASANQLAPGDAMEYVAPDGAPVTVARLTDRGEVSDFIALSSVCPHLGCRVSWEPHNDRFFCPCHNGAFDRTGAPIAGPPKKDGTPLDPYPLKLEQGLLFMDVPISDLITKARRLPGRSPKKA